MLVGDIIGVLWSEEVGAGGVIVEFAVANRISEGSVAWDVHHLFYYTEKM